MSTPPKAPATRIHTETSGFLPVDLPHPLPSPNTYTLTSATQDGEREETQNFQRLTVFKMKQDPHSISKMITVPLENDNDPTHGQRYGTLWLKRRVKINQRSTMA